MVRNEHCTCMLMLCAGIRRTGGFDVAQLMKIINETQGTHGTTWKVFFTALMMSLCRDAHREPIDFYDLDTVLARNHAPT